MSAPRLILASASPRRLDVLRQLGLDPEVHPAHLDESYLPGESPADHVERLARGKAEAVAASEHHVVGSHPEVLVVGGDTVVVHGGRVVAKPVDEDDAVRMLLSLAGSSHEVLSGLALAGPGGGTASAVSRTAVRMRAFDEATARRYVETGEPMDKAGGYGIQGRGAALVEAIEGDYYSVVGFPVGAFLDLLERAGWRFVFEGLTQSSEP